MALDAKTQTEMRLYLLGLLEPGERAGQFEERILTEEDYYEELLIAEDEVIDLYLAGRLPRAEREGFERHFLSTPERRQKLRFARALRGYVADHPAPEPESARGWRAAFGRLLSRPLHAAAVAALVVACAVVGWRVYVNSDSDVRRGLAALEDAYRGRRPVEARITGLAYAPWTVTRGDAPPPADPTARDYAERLLLDAARERPGPAASHALGRLYLAERKYDRALQLFEEALRADADNAQLHNDLGVALFEKGRSAEADDASAQDLEALARSVEHFTRAAELDDSLSEARFNRALAYEHMMLRREAEEAWREYLRRDPDSPWAEEARRHLKRLEEERGAAQTDAGRAVEQFRQARRDGDDEAAWQVVSRGYTPTGNVVTNALLDSLLAADPPAAEEARRTLSDLARLEEGRAGDRHTRDLLAAYERASPRLRPLLAEARARMKAGHELVRQMKFAEAAAEYGVAKSASERAGDRAAAAFAEYCLATALVFVPELQKARAALERVGSACEAGQYLWLRAYCLYRLAHVSFDSSEFTRAVSESGRALEGFERAGDANGVLGCLVQLADAHQAVGRVGRSVGYLRRGLRLAEGGRAEPTLRWGILVQLAFSLNSLRRHAAALLYQQEALSLAQQTGRPLFISRSYGYVGATYAALKLYAEARGHAARALETGRGLPEADGGKEIMANAWQWLGDIHRQAGDCQRALEAYDQSLRLYGELNFEHYSYAAHKGKLICLVEGPDARAAGEELQTVRALFERYRSKITAESHRNSFFDQEQSVYDLGIRYQSVRLGDAAAAFDYSEESRARSLLDEVERGAEVSVGAGGPDLSLKAGTRPLALAELRAAMPDSAQILQYAALEDRLLVWVVSKSDFQVREVPVGAEALAELVRAYLAAAAKPPEGEGREAEERARELYQLLVAPAAPLLDSSKFLCVVPDKALHFLPFGALLSPSTGRYLLEDFDLGLAPSSSLFVSVSESAGAKSGRAGERLVSVGDPSFSRELFPALPRLPAAAREAEAVAAFYPSSQVLRREEAREQTLKAELGRADVAHLALHYVVDGRSELLSGFALAPEAGGARRSAEGDGFLQFHELFGLKLRRTRLVVLSACQTGIEQEYAGEGAVGVTRPFLVAGVPVVVASLWPVDSDASAELMVSFHRHRTRDGLTVARALRRAQIELARGPDTRYRHPFYWAAFAAVGGQTRF